MIKHFSNKSVLTCWQNITAEETSPSNEKNPVSARGFITEVVTASQSRVKLWRASGNTQLFDLASICKKCQKLFDCYTKDSYSLDWLGWALLRMYYSYNTSLSAQNQKARNFVWGLCRVLAGIRCSWSDFRSSRCSSDVSPCGFLRRNLAVLPPSL